MSALILKLQDSLSTDLDLRGLLPEVLCGMSLEKVKKHRLINGKRRIAVGDLFAVSGTNTTRALRIEGSTTQLHNIGRDMSTGSIIVKGDAGHGLGSAMSGGHIRVDGDVGDHTAASMRNGEIQIKGSTGDGLGGLLPGATLGMKNGVIVVDGNVGDRAGERMRRGLIIVNGAAGDYLGNHMVAGTVCVTGGVGRSVGHSMRRGTILLREPDAKLPQGFSHSGPYSSPFLHLLGDYVGQHSRSARRKFGPLSRVDRWLGDACCGGLGEILRLDT